jgi:S-adenosylmethionine decarboxylase
MAISALGRHLLVEVYGCDPKILTNPARVKATMLRAARATKTTVLQSMFHTFDSKGVTGVVLIAQSHLSVHTWPEYGYASVDVYACGGKADPWSAIDVLLEGFKGRKVDAREFRRPRASRRRIFRGRAARPRPR